MITTPISHTAGRVRLRRAACTSCACGCSCRARSTGRSPGHARMARRFAATGAVLRVRRGAVFPGGRGTRRRCGAAARRIHAPGSRIRRSASKNIALTADRGRRRLRPAVHGALPRAVPVQPLRPRASQDRRVRESSSGVIDHRPRRQSLLRPHRLVRRERVRLRLLQGVHRSRQRARARAGAGTGRLSSGDRLQRARVCWRSPAWTRCRFTCRAPRR